MTVQSIETDSGLIRLEAAKGNPWQLHPQLATIWPEPYNTEAKEASAEDSHTGQVMLIKYGHQVIGTTGLFLQDDDFLNVYLRWHGVVPQWRRHGYAGEAIKLIASVARMVFPHRRYLVELAPVTQYGEAVIRFFTSVGFTVHPEQHRYCDEMWWPMLYDLKGH